MTGLGQRPSPPEAERPAIFEFDPLEIYSGTPLEPRRTPPPAEGRHERRPPGEVLEELLAEAVVDQPCHVSFSGGRDSSAILAAATDVARRIGVPDPIPLTARYPAHSSTHESEWQEAVVKHLGLKQWHIFEVRDELDLLGDIAVEALRRYGPYLPLAAHSMILMCRQAAGGTMLTGTGGDEVFTPWWLPRHSLPELRAMRPRIRGLLHAGFDVLPAAWRIRVMVARRPLDPLPWLQPDAQAALERDWRQSLMAARTWRQAVATVVSTRGYEVVRGVLDAFATGEGVRLVEPFFHPRFLAAAARHGPPNGFASRELALAPLVGSLLPPTVLQRSTKATFGSVFMGPRAREFAFTWDGSDVPRQLVDPERLREAWQESEPDARSMPALQHAWWTSKG